MFSIAVVQTKIISCNSTNKSCLLQVVHTKAIAALTQFCDFFFLDDKDTKENDQNGQATNRKGDISLDETQRQIMIKPFTYIYQYILYIYTKTKCHQIITLFLCTFKR